jgi:hypothetical protein
MMSGGDTGYGFVSVAWRCWPNDRMGLMVEFGSGVLEWE